MLRASPGRWRRRCLCSVARGAHAFGAGHPPLGLVVFFLFPRGPGRGSPRRGRTAKQGDQARVTRRGRPGALRSSGTSWHPRPERWRTTGRLAGRQRSPEVRSSYELESRVPGPRRSWLRAVAVGTALTAAPDAEMSGLLARVELRLGVEEQAGRRGVLAGGASPKLAVPGRGARGFCLSREQRLSQQGGGEGGSAGVPARRRSGCPLLAAHWERLGGAGSCQHYFLTRGGEVGWGVERTGEGAAGGARAPEPRGGGSWSPGGPSPASPTSGGASGSVAPAKGEQSLRRARAGGGGEDRLLRCGPSPLVSSCPPDPAGRPVPAGPEG